MTAVWRAQPAEAAHVTALLIAFRDWLHNDEPSPAAMAASVQTLIDDPNTEYLLASSGVGEPPSGVCQLRYRRSVWTTAPDCWLEDLYVESEGRRHGVGRALVEAAFEHARARGAKRIELDTNEVNAPAIALYESLGFSSASKSHAHLHGRDLFMGRPL